MKYILFKMIKTTFTSLFRFKFYFIQNCRTIELSDYRHAPVFYSWTCMLLWNVETINETCMLTHCDLVLTNSLLCNAVISIYNSDIQLHPSLLKLVSLHYSTSSCPRADLDDIWWPQRFHNVAYIRHHGFSHAVIPLWI